VVRAAVSLRFARPPSVLRFYPSAVFARRAPNVPEGQTVPRLEGEIETVVISRRHLDRYREVCGFPRGDLLPIAYPHVLAMPLHLALMTHPAFLVRLMGLVHVANEIEWHRPLSADAIYAIACWVEGHRDTDRGQEFDLFTELRESGAAVWAERCTLLARRRRGAAGAARAARASLRVPRPPDGATVSEQGFHAPRSIGRRYGTVSGDLNPIHGSDFSARRFGFERAVAHGMWSMARSLACLEPELTRDPCRVQVDFKLPLFLPSEVRLEHWREEGGRSFVLRQGDGHRPHLAGSATLL
jgi:acyl dehydratase